jgi:hypothetical protein
LFRIDTFSSCYDILDRRDCGDNCLAGHGDDYFTPITEEKAKDIIQTKKNLLLDMLIKKIAIVESKIVPKEAPQKKKVFLRRKKYKNTAEENEIERLETEALSYARSIRIRIKELQEKFPNFKEEEVK